MRLDPAQAEGVLEDLAELFRVAITDSAESVSLGEEVELAQRYLDIEQIRFGSRLHVTLGARRRRPAARACRRCCCSRWSRTRCATASSRRPRAA